jgi:hypothetical protein
MWGGWLWVFPVTAAVLVSAALIVFYDWATRKGGDLGPPSWRLWLAALARAFVAVCIFVLLVLMRRL